MTLRKTYLDAAKYIRQHGFQERVGERGGPRCFLGALDSVGAYDGVFDPRIDSISGPLGQIVGDFLEPGIWPDRDAAAALEIAADLATP